VTPVAIAWAIEGSDGAKARIAREDYGRVKITWLCGDVVVLTEQQAGQAIANLDVLAPHDVWLRLHEEQHGKDFVAKVVNGRLHAAADPYGDEAGGTVPWEELRALIAPPEEEEDEDEPEPPAIVAEPPPTRAAPLSNPPRFKRWLRERLT
jgi:hypothetical protein